MSQELSCFDNIIGLSRTECECYNTGKPANYNTSLSGLYLDELYPLTAYNSQLNCEKGTDIWEALRRAREQAIIIFRADANALMLKDNQLIRTPFKGKIGRLKYTKEEVITTGDWVGIRMVCDNVVGGKLKIKNIGTIFSETGSFSLIIKNNLNETLHTISLDTITDTHKVNNITDIELDLHSDYTDNLEYYFIYQKNGLTPKSTLSVDDALCSKGGKTQTNQQYGWSEWSNIDGFKKTDVSDLSDVICSTSDKMYGLTFDVEFTCSVEDIWCKDELDFISNNVAIGIALAIRLKAGALFFQERLLSSNINRESLINAENMQAAQDIFNKEYQTTMQFLADNIDITATDCFECLDRIRIIKSTIQT